MTQTPPLAYFWGEDAFSIERAAQRYIERVSPEDEPMEIFKASPEETADTASVSTSVSKRRTRTLDQIEQHLGMAPLFGAGTLVLVRQPGGLLAEKESRTRFLGLASSVPPGNALCVTDLTASGAKGPAASGVLRDSVAELGGEIHEFKVPAPGRLEPWLRDRAAELGLTLQPAAAQLLAERVGGHVREADVDRRRRTELANSELEKLALYKPDGEIEPTDVEALVSESVPGSTWAFLDAVGGRAGAAATVLGERLLSDGTPLPVLVSQLHRRLRDLILVREHIDTGAKPPQIVKALKLQPFRAKKLSEQAGAWSMRSLERALADLLALDLRSKGIALDGSTLQMSEGISALTFQTWISRHATARERAASRAR